ncbi:hypothetical protein HIDPHFAB_00944 [Nocardioides sp. T2.26MG-1]|uniref:helix-turn-helix domain-containing protein n=1 Tax=Nocardioides sp. T2.26MG-1 TaxID=3041166 RepID=UPI0024779A0F|nr:hypothetical protein [Nocardioides sp. T2.26MG-1]CAI9403069.1 hypothetical protein HIDPHFAB_00944 [Nocardioides sp. T2.26MG-1]
MARRLGPGEWDRLRAGLEGRGLIDPDGSLTPAGRELKQSVEDQTDRAAATAYAGLDEHEIDQLVADLRPITAAVVATGEIPARTPIGLDLDDAR